MSDAELGIAKTDAIAANRRIAGGKGLEGEHVRTRNYLGERTMAALMLLLLVIVTVVWLLDVSPWVHYGVTGLAMILIIAGGVNTIRAKSRLEQLREEQVVVHKSDTK